MTLFFSLTINLTPGNDSTEAQPRIELPWIGDNYKSTETTLFKMFSPGLLVLETLRMTLGFLL